MHSYLYSRHPMAVRCGVNRVGSLTICDVERRGESSSRLCIAPWHSSSMQMVGLQPMAHGTVLLLNALRVYLVSQLHCQCCMSWCAYAQRPSSDPGQYCLTQNGNHADNRLYNHELAVLCIHVRSEVTYCYHVWVDLKLSLLYTHRKTSRIM